MAIETAQLARLPFCKEDLSTSLEMTIRAKRYLKAALLIFMRRTTISHF